MADYSKYYRAYMQMQDLLQNDFTYNYINAGLKDGDKGEDTLVGKTNEKVIDMDWVEAIEQALPYIQNAIDEQRRFIKQVDNVVRIELAKKIGPDSVKHLSQHTNFIAKVEGDMVTPNKILTIEREETFATYENRVLMTLIRKALNFVDDKYSKMKDVPNDSYNDIKVARHMDLDGEKVNFNYEYEKSSHDVISDDLDVQDFSNLSDFDRIRRCRQALNEFNNSALIQAIAKEPEVHPPLTQTNLLKKNPNFKKVVDLWNFLDSYKKLGFEIVGEEYEGEMSDTFKQDVYFTMGFEHFMMNIATNPALRRMLQEKYEEENARIAAEEARPEKTREAVLKAQLDAVRKEEMEIRLKEIRERDKQILDLQNEVRNLKNQLDEKERLILSLKGKISALEDELAAVKAELQETKLKLLEAERRIKELEEENQQLKDEIVQLKATIDELNNTIDELNKQIVILNDRIQVLMQENARQQTKIKEQEQQIEEQQTRISELEVQTAEQLAQIAALTDNIAKCQAEIEENNKKIDNLTAKNEKLTNTLQTEREQNREKIQQMNADFAEQTRIVAEQHNNEVKSLKNTIDEADAAHTKYVAQLNAEFADKSNAAEQKRLDDLANAQKEHENQLAKVKRANDAASAAVDAKHASEIRKVQKSVDKRVEAAEKAAEKRFNEKVSAIKKDAQAEIRKAEKKAGEKANAARESIKAVKGSTDIFSRDFSFGSVEVISAYADKLVKSGNTNIGSLLCAASKSIRALCISRSKRGIALSLYTQAGINVVKLYKKTAELDVALADIPDHLKGASDFPICVTYSGVDKTVAQNFANAVNNLVGHPISLAHNKNLKADGYVAIYFNKE